MSKHHQINYVEIPARDLSVTKNFFTRVFDWQFTDYGPEYCSIENASLDGGFYLSEKVATTERGSVLVVLYSDDLEQTMAEIVAHDGLISRAIFSFPGGSRFHFNDPSGNEFAVWKKD
ncbi:MAG: putative enzyme related to lactoylglutathione lyase [Oceanospirillaceae bacterium]|jgi:predicted enzyme related to lactoylglutathione lyase